MACFGRIKGFIANFFIEPAKISKLGNDTMLNFGYALLKKNHRSLSRRPLI